MSSRKKNNPSEEGKNTQSETKSGGPILHNETP